ncbi:DnaJ domain-containing protein [Pseudaminobacter soli (ex Li et al. 2025)]|uniref:Molecular chaperone DnaJ n=1 Tax=Pseudaminobacter soli (ex Li et al. 2025) TaxID=1295366 RepID=A0A2P7SBE7_9HYPH|nr:DnaJ domain-containing protein [Mesorhizobium soli]PSJ59834.1 molecular chaperone DnaJ [Mesorhizobium soli]
MTILLGLLGTVLVIVLMGSLFVRAEPAALARALTLSGPIAIGIIGTILLLLGRAVLGGLLISAAFGWYSMGRIRTSRRSSPGKRSTVRTAALEMELDHDSGRLEGVVLAGRHEQKTLNSMSLSELRELYSDLYGDPESRQLLETYLDGRFPIWRENADANRRDRQGVAPSSGAMTKEEAYKILGLEAGATAADVRKAHRRLMQRLHPDLGGTSFLAARINEAKDVLLTNHD